MPKIYCCFFFLMLFSSRLRAQCFVLADCPTTPDTICDPASNSAQFWNEPYWNDSLHQSHDLAEGSVNLPLYVLDSCGMANLNISFVLLLDLDNDGVRETAVTSANLPPANTVYFGNAANAGYSGGTPRNFDERLVITSQKYRFGLTTELHDDTLVAQIRWINAATSADTINPRLPLGNHRVEWQVQQGSVTKTCQYDFTVRDCWPPTVNCKPGRTVYMPAAGLLNLTLANLLLGAGDNYTPAAQLLLSLREADTNGTDFPLDSAGNLVQQLTFDCNQLGFHLLEVWARDRSGLSGRCQTFIIIQDTAGVCTPPPPVISEACVQHYCNGQGIEGVTFGVQGGNPMAPPLPLFGNGITGTGGCVLLAIPLPLSPSAQFSPSKNNNALNGVSTYDLVLISRHILGIQALDSPYKLIAADVNHSNSVTTFDIVELRKLILGIYQALPNTNSWRFVDAAYAFPNPNNPFQTIFPENLTLPGLVASVGPTDFYGIKVGDVNCSALNLTAPPTDRNISILQMPDIEIPAGVTLNIPVRLARSAAWLGVQGSLIFDPEKLSIEDVSSARLPGWSVDNRTLLAGQVNWSWSAAEPMFLLPDENVLQVSIKTRTAVTLRDVLAMGDVQRSMVLSPEAYAPEENVSTLALQFLPLEDQPERAAIFVPQPNPTTAGVQIPLRLMQQEAVVVEISAITGQILFQTSQILGPGAHLLEVPAASLAQPGLYVWRVQAGSLRKSGKLVKF